jgi:hypothetical protein
MRMSERISSACGQIAFLSRLGGFFTKGRVIAASVAGSGAVGWLQWDKIKHTLHALKFWS